jgi:thiol-disulfide isomerase/thioredoxin
MPPRMDSDLPSLQGGADEGMTWLNTDPIKDSDLKGHTVIVHFWSISCGICKESMPDVENWRQVYGPKGLIVISVHMPRQESDTDIEAVKECMKDYDIAQPVVVDNFHTITDRFENKFVPAYYVYDTNLKMRNFSAGEKAIKMIEPVLERLLGKQEQEAKA